MNSPTTTRRSRWLRGSVGLAAVGLIAALIPAAAASAAPAASPTPPSYLALGDSVAFGYTPPETTPPANYLDADNFVGYPEYIGRALDLSVANASCPGETTGSLIVTTAQSNGCENSVGSPFGYRTVYPLHVKYPNSQLAYAVNYLHHHPMTQLVTIDIGANDAFVCQQVNPDHCTGADLGQLLQQISANVRTIFATLRAAANYHGALLTVSYYSLNYADPVMTAEVLLINRALAGPTKEFGGKMADGFGLFKAASAPYGGDPCKAGLLIALPAGGCNIHPSMTGHLVLAQAVEQAF